MNFALASVASRLSAEYDVPASHVAAVIQVESDGVYEPCQIRWEGHYFYRLLSGAKRTVAVKQGLAAEKMGVVKNPASQAKRQQILNRAMLIDAEAAIMSTSFGVGQVMGSHWKALGFSSAQALRFEAMSGVEGQARLMMRYCKVFGLLDELAAGQWAAFARGYNGPAYRKFKYDTKLAKAANDNGGMVAKLDGMLRLGAKGNRVRELQALLVRAGYSVKVDGDFGSTTRDYVKALQKHLGLEVDGVVGPETMAAFTSYRVSPDEKLGAQKLFDIDGVKKAAMGAVPGVGGAFGAAKAVGGLKDSAVELQAQVTSASDQLSAFSGLGSMVDYAQSGLILVATVIGVGLAGYAAYSWWKSRHTYEGVPTPSSEGIA